MQFKKLRIRCVDACVCVCVPKRAPIQCAYASMFIEHINMLFLSISGEWDGRRMVLDVGGHGQ